MKKIIFVFLVALSLTSCKRIDPQYPVSINVKNSCANKCSIEFIEVDHHSYIFFIERCKIAAVVHNPDCPTCKP